MGDAFIHELNMEVNGMPKSYLIRQCRDKLNSACSIRSTLGDAPGAQVSFREALINKLNILASINSLSINNEKALQPNPNSSSFLSCTERRWKMS